MGEKTLKEREYEAELGVLRLGSVMGTIGVVIVPMAFIWRPTEQWSLLAFFETIGFVCGLTSVAICFYSGVTIILRWLGTLARSKPTKEGE